VESIVRWDISLVERVCLSMGYLLTHEVYLQIGLSAENIRPLVERGEGLLCLSMHPPFNYTHFNYVGIKAWGVGL